MRQLLLGVVVAAGICGLRSTPAVAITFNWENHGTGTATVPIYQIVDGLAATASGVGGYHAVVVIFPPPGMGAAFGNRSLTVSGGNADALRVDFSAIALSVTVQFGDMNADDDGMVTLAAYNALNVLVDIETLLYGTQIGARSLTVDAPDIAYILTSSSGYSPGYPYPNSLVWDSFAVTPIPGFIPVPEPGTLTLLGLGLATLAGARRFCRVW